MELIAATGFQGQSYVMLHTEPRTCENLRSLSCCSLNMARWGRPASHFSGQHFSCSMRNKKSQFLNAFSFIIAFIGAPCFHGILDKSLHSDYRFSSLWICVTLFQSGKSFHQGAVSSLWFQMKNIGEDARFVPVYR
jgi:hypothetical protein